MRTPEGRLENQWLRLLAASLYVQVGVYVQVCTHSKHPNKLIKLDCVHTSQVGELSRRAHHVIFLNVADFLQFVFQSCRLKVLAKNIEKECHFASVFILIYHEITQYIVFSKR